MGNKRIMNRYLRNIIVASIAIHVIIGAGAAVYYHYFYVPPEIKDKPVSKNSGGGSSSGSGGVRADAGGGSPSKAMEVKLEELPEDPNAKSEEELTDFAQATKDRQKDLTDEEKLAELNRSIDAIGLEDKDPEDVKQLASKGLELVTGEDISTSDIDRKVSDKEEDHFEVDPDKVPKTEAEKKKFQEQAKNINKFDHRSAYPHDMVLEDGWYKYIMIDKNGRTLKFKHKKAEDMTDQDMTEYRVLKMGKNKNMKLLLNAIFESGNKKINREADAKKKAEENQVEKKEVPEPTEEQKK